MERHITVPVAKEEIQDLRAGDYVYLTGVIYTARDAAHKRMDEVLSEGKELPLFTIHRRHTESISAVRYLNGSKRWADWKL